MAKETLRVPKKIVSDRGTQFTSHFWKQLHESLGTRLVVTPRFRRISDRRIYRDRSAIIAILSRKGGAVVVFSKVLSTKWCKA